MSRRKILGAPLCLYMRAYARPNGFEPLTPWFEDPFSHRLFRQ